ncbi:DUF551 domain-containing protein [Enterobacter asburiae]
MSTITKEWLQQKIAEMEASRDEIPFGLDEDGSNTLAALRIALASLKAEPVAYTEECEITNMQATGLYLRGFPYGSHGRDIALYTTPPAPVSVPEWTNEQCMEFLSIAFRHAEINGDLQLDDIRLGVKMVNGSRAAMLQGADGNSPDGWVACSERMPDKLIPVMVMYADGEMWSAIWTGTKWDDGTEFPDPHAVTYWQEMPAAPQQEVK